MLKTPTTQKGASREGLMLHLVPPSSPPSFPHVHASPWALYLAQCLPWGCPLKSWLDAKGGVV